MADQAQHLRRLADDLKANIAEKSAPRRTRPTRVIAITSGKGGVGKTNLAVNLGIALIQMGHDVLLLDADLGLANVDVILGTNPTHHLGHVIRGEKRMQDIIYRGPAGIKLVAGGSGLQELLDLSEAELNRFIQGLQVLETQANYILLDTGAGLSRSVTSFVLAADEIVVVTNSEPTAMTDAYAAIKVITRQRPSATIRLIMNQVDDEDDAEVATNRLAMAALRFLGVQVESLGYIPDDPCVSRSVKKQQPFVLCYPTCSASKSVKGLAKLLAGQAQEDALGSGLFFDRLARFFANLRA